MPTVCDKIKKKEFFLMRRGGILAFIIYFLTLAASLGLMIYCRTYTPPEGGNFGEALGVAILYIYSIFVAVPSAVLFVLKLINMLTGWKLFSVLCLLCDIVLLGALILLFLQNGAEGIEALVLLPIIGVALISELVGLRR